VKTYPYWLALSEFLELEPLERSDIMQRYNLVGGVMKVYEKSSEAFAARERDLKDSGL
jgi:hypothetical protein